MRDPRTGLELYPRLIASRSWEIPRPGREAVIGFFVVGAVSLLLHGAVIWLCEWLRG